ncbi:MAG: hypothetical protein HF967_10120 [Methanosarcinales archaeon]|nr:hypothetical protein [Methanosarcinales archaeon]
MIIGKNQKNNPNLHPIDYYDFIENLWQNNATFRNQVLDSTNHGWWPIAPHDCPEYAVKLLASYSNQYVNRLIDGILYAGCDVRNYPEDWQNCSVMISISEDVMTRSVEWNRGLAEYVFQG